MANLPRSNSLLKLRVKLKFRELEGLRYKVQGLPCTENRKPYTLPIISLDIYFYLQSIQKLVESDERFHYAEGFDKFCILYSSRFYTLKRVV